MMAKFTFWGWNIPFKIAGWEHFDWNKGEFHLYTMSTGVKGHRVQSDCCAGKTISDHPKNLTRFGLPDPLKRLKSTTVCAENVCACDWRIHPHWTENRWATAMCLGRESFLIPEINSQRVSDTNSLHMLTAWPLLHEPTQAKKAWCLLGTGACWVRYLTALFASPSDTHDRAWLQQLLRERETENV